MPQHGGSAPATLGFNAIAPEWLLYGAAVAAPAIPAAESTLGSHPCVALSSAQVLPEWINRNLAGNRFAANGDNPLNFVSHSKGSLHMELTDTDVTYLRELAKIEGALVELKGRIERWAAHQTWEQGSWRSRIDSDIDSAFSKLESYGLVSRIPPPNNLNITADFQNRYVLLMKGLRFIKLIEQTAAPT